MFLVQMPSSDRQEFSEEERKEVPHPKIIRPVNGVMDDVE